VTAPNDSTSDDLGFSLMDAVSPPLYLTVLLGAVTSLRLSSGIAVETARDLATVGRRLAFRERQARVTPPSQGAGQA